MLSARCLLPDNECRGPDCAVGGSCHEVSAWMEVAINECVSEEEVLGRLCRESWVAAEQPRGQPESQLASEKDWFAGRSRPAVVSWPLQIMSMSSMPARVTAADQKD